VAFFRISLLIVWLIALLSALPQLPGLSVIAVPAAIGVPYRLLAQFVLFAPLVVMRWKAEQGRARLIDALLALFALVFAHFPAPFFDYIWDVCLIETTYVFLLSEALRQTRLRRFSVWPLRLLLFRLMFSMGVFKFLYGMPEWRDGTALQFFWPNQPMPAYLAWHAAQLPKVWQQAMAAYVFLAEIPGPFLIFCGVRARRIYFWITLLLQLGIFVTGNYGIFNLLTAVLSLSLLESKEPEGQPSLAPAGAQSRVISYATVLLLFSWLFAGVWYQVAVFYPGMRHLPETSWVFLQNPEQRQLPSPLLRLLQLGAAAKISNPYALFGHIPKYRMEIEVWGSLDKIEWKKYRFRIKPDETARAPLWYAPHHWRLDHQFYYEAFRIRAPELSARYSFFLGSRWMPNFLRALFAGDQRVLSLLRENPFPASAPRYLQLRYTYYAFTDYARWRATGNYWQIDKPHAGQFFDGIITPQTLDQLP
jgi:hypothetical protein